MDSVKQQVSPGSKGKQKNHKPFFQPKLAVNQPNDIYEQEADATAEKVMREPAGVTNKNAFFKPAASLVQKDDKPGAGATLTGGAGVVKDALGDKPGFDEWQDKQTDALKKKLWDDQPTELKAAIIGSALASAGLLGGAFAGDKDFRTSTISTLQDKNLLMPTALLPYHDYYGISSLKYKLPAAKNAPYTFDAEFEYKPLMDFLHKNVAYFPKTDLTLGVSSAYSAQKGFGVTGGSIKLKLGGGIVNVQAYLHQPLPPTPSLVSGTDPGESPMWMMRSLPSQADDKLATGSGVFITVDVLRLPELFHKNDKPDVGVQRKCADCEKEEKISRKETNDTSTHDASSSVEQSLQSGGQPLDKGTRSFMEQRFGYDFGGVRVHNDAQAHQSSADINALAYTHKDHIVFGNGQYSPETDNGKRLLAHELTHVVQQGDNIQQKSIEQTPDKNVVQRDDKPAPQSKTGDPDADAVNSLIAAAKWQDAFDKLTPLNDNRVVEILAKLSGIIDPVSNISSLTLLRRNKPVGVQPRFDGLIYRANNFVTLNPMHSDEIGISGDKLELQTFTATGDPIPDVIIADEQKKSTTPIKRMLTKEFSIFLPKGMTAVNKVHIFFTPFLASHPDAAAGSVAQQGLRAETDQSDWILIGVPALDETDQPNFVTISTPEIETCLKAAGRPAKIDTVRLSAHSRGHRGLENTMGLRPGSKPLIDLGLVQKITVFDASYQDLGRAINSHQKELTAMADPNKPGQFKADAVQLYDVTVTNISGFKGIHLDTRSIRALSYTRLIQEGLSKGDISASDLNVLPQNILDATNRISGKIPVRGNFSTKNPPPAGKTNMQDFYTDKQNHDDLMLIDSREIKGLIGTKKLDAGQQFNLEIDAHHWFVAELAHEAVE